MCCGQAVLLMRMITQLKPRSALNAADTADARYRPLKGGSGPRIWLQAWTHCMAMAGMVNIIDLVML